MIKKKIKKFNLNFSHMATKLEVNPNNLIFMILKFIFEKVFKILQKSFKDKRLRFFLEINKNIQKILVVFYEVFW